MSEEQRQARREQVRRQEAEPRNAMPEEQRQDIQEQNRIQHADARARNLRNRREPKLGTKTADILSGRIPVPDLFDSPESIGFMDQQCDQCGAYKFKSETSRLCCLNGKVVLDPFPTPPPVLQELWLSDNREAKVFRDHCRAINNAVSLSSLGVTQNRHEGFSPTVIFQGRVVLRFGPLHPKANEQAKFAQLYVLDSNMESTCRVNRLTVPTTISRVEKEILENHLHTVQAVIHEVNPFVKDIKQIVEIPY